MRLPVVLVVVVFAIASSGGVATARGLTYWQAVRAIDAQLAKREGREDLEISLAAIHRGTRVARVLEAMRYVERLGDGYRFTPSAVAQSKPCDDAEPQCRIFAFGTSSRAGRPLYATLYSRATTFNEPLWTYWFTYIVKPVTAFAVRAAREGLVDTISTTDTRCPAIWSPALPLLANASVGPDLPFQMEIKSRLYLHGAVSRPRSTSELVCDFSAMQLEIDRADSIVR